jgi:hypothetical protein
MGSGNIIYDCVANANQYGINVIGNNKVMNCIADSNIVSGIILANTDSLINCTMRNNGIGLHSYASLGGGSIITKNIIENNNIGIKLEGYADSIYCNRICNSSSYDLYYNVLFGSNSIVANNDWCTIDSISTSAVIFDGYDDVNLGLVSFLPIDTLQCYLNSSVIYSGHPTTIFTIFPNPTTNSITVQLFSDHRTTIKILNLLGEVLYVTSTSTREKEIDISW